MSHTSLPSIEKLKGRENYDAWKFAVRAYLEHEELWDCVASETAADTKKDTKARSKIILLIDSINFVHVQSAKTAREAWTNLEKAFQDNGLTRRVGLLRKLITTRMEDSSSVEEYVNQIVTTAHKLNGVGLQVSEEWIGTLLLAGLSEEYKPMIMGIESSGVPITGDAIKTKILQDVKVDNGENKVAFYGRKGQRNWTTKKKINSNSSTSGSSKGPRCYECKNYGHIARNCPSKRCSNEGAPASSKGVFYTSFAVSSVQRNGWYIDSGASAHMCSSEDMLSDVSQAPQKEVIIANNMRLSVEGVGYAHLPVAGVNGSEVRVEDVLCIPKLCTNLLSVSQIVRKGNTVVFNTSGCKIYNAEKELVATASHDGELFKLDSPVSDRALVVNSFDAEFNLWHRRMGHLNAVSLRQLSDRFGNRAKFPTVNNMNCEVCLKGKQSRLPFNHTGTRANDLLELVHSDLCGPIHVTSMGGARYILVFVDDYSRKVFVYFLTSKNETRNRFQDFKALVENQCNKRIKILRTDNGSEYCNSAFQTLLRKYGIRHQTSAPYTPQQNGLVERMNRTIIEKARCMLLDANVSKSLWAEAVAAAVFIINRSPSSSSTGYVPEEVWSGKTPDMSRLRIFGCKAMVHIPKERRKKLDPKSEACIFVGYCEEAKAYRLYNPNKKKIVISRDVVFFEHKTLSSVEVIEKYNFVNSSELFSDVADAVGDGDSGSACELASEEDQYCSDSDGERSYNSCKDEIESGSLISELQNTPSQLEGEYIIPHSVNEISSSSTQPTLRRSQRETKPLIRDDYISYAAKTGELHEPLTVSEALDRPDSELWRQAMAEELESLRENKTWELVDLPCDKKAINCKWVFKTKRDSEGNVYRYKARLVVKGCAQKKGIDYEETFSPVVRYSSIRFLLSLAAQYDLDIDQMDAVTAFLQGDLGEEIYMLQPEGFTDNTGKVCHLKKSLYGLKQASRLWNQKLDTALKKFGLKRSNTDPCVYYSGKDTNLIMVAIYVDDFLIFTKDKDIKKELKAYLHCTFKMKDMGEARFALGMQITRDRSKGIIRIDQERYINEILARFNMTDCNPSSTPMDANQKLTKLMSPQTEQEKINMSEIPYQEAVGSIMFAAQVSRPDVSFAVSAVSRYNNNYGKAHWTAVKRILRYLKGTVGAKLEFSKFGDGNIKGYCDADWANDTEDRRSFTGYVFVSRKGAVSWNSKKQPTVALSSTEAEYMAVSSATQEAIWLKNLEAELISSCPNSTTICCDNKGAISLALTSAYHPRTKHIDVRHHFIRNKIEDGTINLKYICTDEMIADFLTKALNYKKHFSCSKAVGLIFK